MGSGELRDCLVCWLLLIKPPRNAGLFLFKTPPRLTFTIYLALMISGGVYSIWNVCYKDTTYSLEKQYIDND